MALTFATNNTITDSDSGLVSFKDDDYIQIMGSTSNDGYYQIGTSSAAMLTLRDSSLDNYGVGNALVAESGSLNTIGIVKLNFVPSGPNKASAFPARKRCAAMHSVRSDGTEEYANRVDDMQWMQVESLADLFDVTPSTRCGEGKHKYGRGRVKGLNTQGAKIITNADLVNGEFTNVSAPNNTITDPMFTSKTQYVRQHGAFLMQDGQFRIQGYQQWGASGGGQQWYNGGGRDFGWSFLWNDMLESGIDWFMQAKHNTYWITNDGRLWCAGTNENSQVGEAIGNPAYKSTPHWIRGASDSLVGKKAIDFDVSDANTLHAHCILLTDDYKVWCWGENVAGQCSTTSNVSDNMSFPTQVTTFSAKKMVAVYAHGSYNGGMCAAIEEDGTPWTWGGQSATGALGDGTQTNRTTPVSPINLPAMPCIGIAGMGGGSTGTGPTSTFFIMRDHSIYACGTNNLGQLGIGSTATPISTPTRVLLDDNSSPSTNAYPIKLIVSSNNTYPNCCAIMSDWTVRTWGWNGNGVLGSGNIQPISTPYNPAGINDEAYGFVDAIFSNFVDTSVALFLLRFDGTVWSAGYNGNGVLGKGHDQGNFDNNYFPFTDNWEDSYGSDGYHNNFGQAANQSDRVFSPLSAGNHNIKAIASWGNQDSSTWTAGFSEGGYALGWGYDTSLQWAYTAMDNQSGTQRMTPQGGPMPNVK